MKNLRKIIIMLIILLIIFALILGVVIILFLNNETSSDNVDSADYSVTLSTTIEPVNDYNNYYTVNNAIVMYFNYIYEKNSEAICDILEEEYQNNHNITPENVLEQVVTIEDEHFSFDIEEAYNKESYQTPTYCIYGQLNLLDSQTSTDYYFIVYTDTGNMTYIIEPITKEQYQSIVNSETELQNKEITANNYNKLIYITTNEETIVTRLLYDYKQKALNEPEEAYELLDNEYREAKFTDVDDFIKYIQKSKISSAMLSQYEKRIKDNSTQYICVDQNGNYYIFNVTGVMQYSVILDTYTIDLPQFVEQYNNSSDAEKVLLNIQKVFYAINKKDYNYVYSKLDATFKANNFPTEEEFEEYMTNTFFEKNSVGYNEYQTRGNLHIYNIVITDDENDNERTIEKEFIMQLKEGTDFVMSFNV